MDWDRGVWIRERPCRSSCRLVQICPRTRASSTALCINLYHGFRTSENNDEPPRNSKTLKFLWNCKFVKNINDARQSFPSFIRGFDSLRPLRV